MAAKFKVNPYYVSAILGPLALAAAKEEGHDVLASVDYSDESKIQLIINSLIQPSFDRLAESTKIELARALGYFSSRCDVASKVIEEKLLLCEVPPCSHRLFLAVLWGSLFPDASAADMARDVGGVVPKPLVAGQFSFAKKATRTLEELMDRLRLQLLE